ncbi:hexokinase [Ranunculus cassubicifolius]
MLKAPDHQVAGHSARDGKLGPLIDESGLFYKPLQNDERGAREEAFYTSLSSNKSIPNHIRRFFPEFHGTKQLEASDGSGLHPHLVLQDLVSSRVHPSVMDVKMGMRTWYPQASEDYIKKCLKKDKESTGWTLGFRISGLQSYDSEELGFWKPDKKCIKSFNVEDVRSSLRRFVSSNPLADSKPNCAFASVVYGGSKGILAQLLELKAWFETQTFYQFNSCSVLMMYEKKAAEAGISSAEVKLVDFAHVVDGQGVIDHNFLGGLCSLIKFISDIVFSPMDDANEGASVKCAKNQSCAQNGSTE